MKFSHHNSHQNTKLNKGFSLIEMSVVILIIGILIAGISRGIDLYLDFKIQTAQKLRNEEKSVEIIYSNSNVGKKITPLIEYVFDQPISMVDIFGDFINYINPYYLSFVEI
jgi:prepilin-type N-terminal cleavage/methylation domain-containing protein